MEQETVLLKEKLKQLQQRLKVQLTIVIELDVATQIVDMASAPLTNNNNSNDNNRQNVAVLV